MFVKHEISVYEFVRSIAETVDLVSPALNGHHKKVARIACNIAMEMNLPNGEIQDIVLASMLHDIGAFSIGERIKDLTFELDETEMSRHAVLGYNLLKGFEPLAKAAAIIKCHHANFDASRCDVPLGSYIIHLADRAVVLFDSNREILAQVPKALEKISKKSRKFHPDVFAAFLRMARLEYVWMEAFMPSSCPVMPGVRFSKEIIDLETLQNFAQVIARIIDFRSRFTATHSSGVAAVAQELTVICGFSERECKMMEIAGLLHDLGKLSVSNDILEKEGALNDDEFNLIKKHTYFTFAVLTKINGLEDMAAWAAYRHERQDGNGYPFHVQGGEFSKLSRVMAVADILTALTEDRPHRPGMDRENVSEILYALAENGGIDKGIVELANKNSSRSNDVRVKAQQDARGEYDAFCDAADRLLADNAGPEQKNG
jgi:HD-GYP domain-containing protein (c-di-GMP phosphodiesterase class II)